MVKRYLILGHPRSGNTWLRYICRALYGLPQVPGHLEDDNPEVIGYIPNPIFIKRHWLNDSKYLLKPEYDLICIVRNYKECIVRHNNRTDDDMFLTSLKPDINKTIPSYIHPLKIYNEYRKSIGLLPIP